jgi:hypothetical protein
VTGGTRAIEVALYRKHMRSTRLFVALSAAGALTCLAPVRAAVPAGSPVHGIRCDQMEGSTLHIHQHLAISDHGKPVAIPDDVGRPLVAQCLYWIHTHTSDGIIHIEAPNFHGFTLGDFFAVWGQPLGPRDVAGAKPKPGERVAVWVSGRPYGGDLRTLELLQHFDVTIQVGPPYVKPAPFTAWNGN